jgi:DNA-binding MarR family transcriptional regulator
LNIHVKGAEVISLFCRINVNTRRDISVRSSEMGMLIYLVKSGLDATPVKIAEFFKVTKPMVTSMANSLSKKGYIIKEPSKTDKRSVTLKPTEKAIQLVEQTYAEYYKNMNLLIEGMGIEKFETLVNLLEMANTILVEGKKNG